MCSFITGILLYYFARIPPLICAVGGSIFCVLALWRIRFLYIVTVFLAACVTWSAMPPRTPPTGRKARYSGVVVSEEHFGSYNRVLLHLNRVEINNICLPVSIPVQAYTPGSSVHLGNELVVQGQLHPPRFATRQAVLAGPVKQAHDPGTPVWRIVQRIRAYIDMVFSDVLARDRRDVATGLVVGGSGHLTPSLKKVFARAGILHILAVSGLHIGFVCLFGYALFSLTFLPRYARFIGVMIIVAGYLFVTSFRPSVCRAAFMAGMFGIALLLQRNVNRLHVANVTALILLVIDPLLLFSLSFQLSFAAVYGILYLYPKIHHAVLARISWKPLRMVCAPLAISLSAQCFVTPFIIHYFQRVSLVAPLTNLVVVPLASCTVFLLYVILILHGIWHGGACLAALATRPLLDLIAFTARTAAALPFSMVILSVPLSVLVCTWGLFIPRIRKYAVVTIGIVLILTGIAGLSEGVVIAASGDTVIVRCPDRRTILCSPGGSDDARSIRIAGVLDGASVDYAVFTGREPLEHVHARYGDVSIEIDTILRVLYKKREFHYCFDDTSAQTAGDVRYVVTNGRHATHFRAPAQGSIIDDLATELQVTVARCLLLF